MYSPLRKALECQISYLEDKTIWSSISEKQAGARPNSKMYLQTVKVIEEMHSGKWKLAWFVDYTEAFNRIH